MLAARDQENLAHGHHTAAAAKPLNQGSKQLAPKTPGNKAPKTPFKIPLNDENAPLGFGGGKTGLKTNARGNENFILGSKKGGAIDKNAFITPLGILLYVRTERYRKLTAAPNRTAYSSSTGTKDHQCQSQSLPDTCSSRGRQWPRQDKAR